eukprot:4406933-Prymnesium_polylepis.1
MAAERRHSLHRRRRPADGGAGAQAAGGHDAGSGAVPRRHTARRQEPVRPAPRRARRHAQRGGRGR